MPKHTIRDILPPEHRGPKRRPMRPSSEGEEGDERMERNVEMNEGIRERHTFSRPPVEGLDMKMEPPRRGGFKYAKWLYAGGGIIIAVLIIAFLFSVMFGGAEVTVHPKTQTLTVNGDFTAVRENPAKGDLSYNVMTLESMQTKDLPATGTEHAEEKASGQIIIYNNYNTLPQRLIRNTRFETPDGLIYRIDKSVVVPGETKANGTTTPGSVEVTVYADQAGDKYNIGLVDFTIPGFKGAPQYDGFYARSKTPMTGGFVGDRNTVDDTALANARDAMHTALKKELMGKVSSQRPDGFISFDPATYVVFTSDPLKDSGNQVEVTEKATLYGVLFDEHALANYLAAHTLSGFDGSDVKFTDISKLVLAPDSTSTNGEGPQPWVDPTFSFHMSGSAPIVWQFDENKLKHDLSGRNKEAIHTILSGYPGIDKAEVVIRPFWKSTFPTDPKEITIKTVTATQ